MLLYTSYDSGMTKIFIILLLLASPLNAIAASAQSGDKATPTAISEGQTAPAERSQGANSRPSVSEIKDNGSSSVTSGPGNDKPPTIWDKLLTFSEVLRNFGLILAAFFGLWIAYQRAESAEKQAAASKKQANAAVEQAKLAKKGNKTNSFAKAVELLGHDNESIRPGGAFALKQLVDEETGTYGKIAKQLIPVLTKKQSKASSAKTKSDLDDLASDERHKAAVNGQNETKSAPTAKAEKQAANAAVLEGQDSAPDNIKSTPISGLDIQALHTPENPIQLPGADLSGMDLQGANYKKANLCQAYLNSVNLQEANLRQAKLLEAKLRIADLQGADLQGAELLEADLYNASLQGANFHETNLKRANISGANFTGAKGLGQVQILSACADPDNPPIGLPDGWEMPPPCPDEE